MQSTSKRASEHSWEIHQMKQHNAYVDPFPQTSSTTNELTDIAQIIAEETQAKIQIIPHSNIQTLIYNKIGNLREQQWKNESNHKGKIYFKEFYHKRSI